MIKNLADAEKLGNESASTYILVTQLIEIFHICIFQLPKILRNPKKYLKVELKTDSGGDSCQRKTTELI